MPHANRVYDLRYFDAAPSFCPLKIACQIVHIHRLKLLSANFCGELLWANDFAGASIRSFIALTAGAALSAAKIR